MANRSAVVIVSGQVQQLQPGDTLAASAISAGALTISGSAVTLSGPVAFVGANTLSITTTGATAVTLPTTGLLTSLAMARRIASLHG